MRSGGGWRAQFPSCRLAPEALQAADAWLGDYRRYFETKFDRLEAQLRAELDGNPEETKPWPDSGSTWASNTAGA